MAKLSQFHFCFQDILLVCTCSLYTKVYNSHNHFFFLCCEPSHLCWKIFWACWNCILIVNFRIFHSRWNFETAFQGFAHRFLEVVYMVQKPLFFSFFWTAYFRFTGRLHSKKTKQSQLFVHLRTVAPIERRERFWKLVFGVCSQCLSWCRLSTETFQSNDGIQSRFLLCCFATCPYSRLIFKEAEFSEEINKSDRHHQT